MAFASFRQRHKKRMRLFNTETNDQLENTTNDNKELNSYSNSNSNSNVNSKENDNLYFEGIAPQTPVSQIRPVHRRKPPFIINSDDTNHSNRSETGNFINNNGKQVRKISHISEASHESSFDSSSRMFSGNNDSNNNSNINNSNNNDNNINSNSRNRINNFPFASPSPILAKNVQNGQISFDFINMNMNNLNSSDLSDASGISRISNNYGPPVPCTPLTTALEQELNQLSILSHAQTQSQRIGKLKKRFMRSRDANNNNNINVNTNTNNMNKNKNKNNNKNGSINSNKSVNRFGFSANVNKNKFETPILHDQAKKRSRIYDLTPESLGKPLRVVTQPEIDSDVESGGDIRYPPNVLDLSDNQGNQHCDNNHTKNHENNSNNDNNNNNNSNKNDKNIKNMKHVRVVDAQSEEQLAQPSHFANDDDTGYIADVNMNVNMGMGIDMNRNVNRNVNGKERRKRKNKDRIENGRDEDNILGVNKIDIANDVKRKNNNNNNNNNENEYKNISINKNKKHHKKRRQSDSSATSNSLNTSVSSVFDSDMSLDMSRVSVSSQASDIIGNIHQISQKEKRDSIKNDQQRADITNALIAQQHRDQHYNQHHGQHEQKQNQDDERERRSVIIPKHKQVEVDSENEYNENDISMEIDDQDDNDENISGLMNINRNNNNSNNNNSNNSNCSDDSFIKRNKARRLDSSVPGINKIKKRLINARLVESKSKSKYDLKSPLSVKPVRIQTKTKSQYTRYGNDLDKLESAYIIKMETLKASPAQEKKFGSKTVVSPVRRSKRIANNQAKQHEEEEEQTNFGNNMNDNNTNNKKQSKKRRTQRKRVSRQGNNSKDGQTTPNGENFDDISQMLKESNYAYMPNPNLATIR